MREQWGLVSANFICSNHGKLKCTNCTIEDNFGMESSILKIINAADEQLFIGGTFKNNGLLGKNDQRFDAFLVQD